MFTCVSALDDVASSRARRELTALVQRPPKVTRVRRGEDFETVPVAEVQPGDVILVGAGEVVPVVGTVLRHEAVLDTSTLSGEPLPQTVSCGMSVLSGSANAGSPFELAASRAAAESAYAGLVRLGEQAQEQRAPFVWMDRDARARARRQAPSGTARHRTVSGPN